MMKPIIDKAKSVVIRTAYYRWRYRPADPRFGYTLLVPVPGDLPVFMQIVLDILSRQDVTHLLDILIIPDMPSKKFRALFQTLSRQSPHAKIIRLVEMPPRARWIGKMSRSGNMFHFLQLVSGIETARSTHVIFHDADLFLPPGDFIRRRFERCAARDLSVLGVDPRERRYTEDCRHLVATWEMVATSQWIHRFKPHQLRGMQQMTIGGKRLKFDTTHLMQYLSDETEIDYEKFDGDFVHFNYVITTYRRFQKSPKPFDDRWFKLLLIRLLIDAMASPGWRYPELPVYDDFVEGLQGRNGRVNCASSAASVYYPDFRKHLEALFHLGCFTIETNGMLNALIQPFDSHFNWVRPP